MARMTAVKGFPLAVMPNGGGLFSRVRTQTMASREGTLAMMGVAEDAGGCCGGESGCCDTGEGVAACCPDCDAPVPDTATGDGTGGVIDEHLTLQWRGAVSSSLPTSLRHRGEL